ncbi:NADAR family protein [Salinispirillum sp. LH 10-3-1]|uniref:NADAR family protein n=1 Tax=Salinispirillum sp. LH 10-3-1 TaxID=2952525 RepID=A0AB38YGY7_9GAMM
MALFASDTDESAITVNRLDPSDPLGCSIPRPFTLDDFEWPTAEHYYQAMKYPDRARFDHIRRANDVEQARKLGRGWLKRPRADWKSVRTIMLTRAIYTQARTHADFAAALLATGDQNIVETSQYDYFWGIGRDQRGQNQYGKVLQNVRAKLMAEATG